MRSSIFFAVAASAFTLPQVLAQAPIAAPPGWKSAPRANGVRVFSPPDLQAGEVYSAAVYDSAPLDGATLEEWLRKFAGPVKKEAGKLSEPLKVTVQDGRIVTGSGVYVGPNNSSLGVIFVGVSIDGGANVHVMRTLYSSPALIDRYQAQAQVLAKAMIARAKAEAGRDVLVVPDQVGKMMKPGGEIVPGVYAGNQYRRGVLERRMRVYVYASGEYRITDHNDADILDRWKDVIGTGKYLYNRNSGQMTFGRSNFGMSNSSDASDGEFCFYGRDASGKPIIYAEQGIFDEVTTLRFAGPPTKRISPGEEEARQAAAEAEKKRYKWVTPPGKGVTAAQIAAILHHYDVQVYSAGMNGVGTNVTDEAFLLLKDGTVHAGLPVAPDQLDATRSRQKEPETWGRWRLKGTSYQVSWDGGPYQALKGAKVAPGTAGLKLAGRYGTGSSSASMAHSSYSFRGVTFDKSGRFKKDSRGGSSNGAFAQSMGQAAINSTYDDSGSTTNVAGDGFAISSGTKNPNGAREGTYSINGYVLTLRYDSGRVVRLPFFFSDAGRKSLWFEGSLMSLDDKK